MAINTEFKAANKSPIKPLIQDDLEEIFTTRTVTQILCEENLATQIKKKLSWGKYQSTLS